MTLNSEIWKKTTDLCYEVSNFGNVRSVDRFVQSGPKTSNGKRKAVGVVLTPFISKNTGYYQVGLSGRVREYVHRLVASAFCDGYFEGAEVNHINGVKNDNRASNLEWCTSSENINHSYKKLGRKAATKGKFGKEHPTSKPIKMTCLKSGNVEFFDCALMAVKKYKSLNSGGISRCCNLKSKFHKGFNFEFT